MFIMKEDIEAGIIKILVGAKLGSKDKKPVGAVELDIESQAGFVSFMNELFEDDATQGARIIVDMENIEYLDSSGLWALFEGHKRAIQKSGELVLLGATKEVKRVLDITKISSKIRTFQTEKEAISKIKSEGTKG